MKPEDIARICHEANRAYCLALGDDSQPLWEQAPQWQRDSAIKGVEFNLGNPGAAPSASHDSWLEVKLADGWRYGAVKSAEKKEHPCCVPYEKLSQEQQLKDYLFKAICGCFGAAARPQLCDCTPGTQCCGRYDCTGPYVDVVVG